MNSKTNHQRGLRAEKIAKIWLLLKGYRILEERYRNRYGEIDLILQKRKRLIAVEIKLRQTLHKAGESITPLQQARIERALTAYLQYLPWQPQEIRFDAVLVTPFSFPKHIKNAWQSIL